jgi:hypothetical protein
MAKLNKPTIEEKIADGLILLKKMVGGTWMPGSAEPVFRRQSAGFPRTFGRSWPECPQCNSQLDKGCGMVEDGGSSSVWTSHIASPSGW